MPTPTPRLVTDLTLSRRLERAEAAANAAFVESRRERDDSSGATWREIGGTYAMFDGVGSPLTQTFGLGLFADLSDQDLDAIEAFFTGHGAELNHEVSPMADPATLAMLPARGYRPVEFTTVLYMPLPDSIPAGHDTAPSPISARRIGTDELASWSDASARGWGASPELATSMHEFGTVSGQSHGTACFVAEQDGAIIATAAVAIHNGVALLAGASTIAEWRGRGAQTALLAARLAYAADQGCDLAVVGAAPGSTSQVNAERQGFRIAYTRLKWHRAAMSLTA